MSCATSTIKYLVFLFNALCALFGIGVIVVNAIGLKDVNVDQRPILIFFIVIGSIIFLISFFGCCGAIKENVCLTWMYSIIMLLLLVASAVLIFVYLHPIDEKNLATTQMTDAFNSQKNNTGNGTMDTWQSSLKCCGINGSADYTNAKMPIPSSCYPSTTNKIPYSDGCLPLLIEFYEKTFKFIRVFGWVLISIEAGAFVFATILAINFNNENRRSRY